jgi:hypothetical protein
MAGTRSLREDEDEEANLTLLGHVAVQVLLGPEAAEEVLGHMFFGLLHGFAAD